MLSTRTEARVTDSLNRYETEWDRAFVLPGRDGETRTFVKENDPKLKTKCEGQDSPRTAIVDDVSASTSSRL
jgi:hypothetical protein